MKSPSSISEEPRITSATWEIFESVSHLPLIARGYTDSQLGNR